MEEISKEIITVKQRNYLRVVAASVMFAVMVVVLPAVLVSSEEMPIAIDPDWENIYIKGVELDVALDGSIQAKMDVWLREVWYGSGVIFRMHYNRDYMVPSNAANNSVWEDAAGGGVVERSDFFEYNPELLYDGSNPYDLDAVVYYGNPGGMEDIRYGAWDSSGGSIHMALLIDASTTGNTYRATRPDAVGVERLLGTDVGFSPMFSGVYRSGQIVGAKTMPSPLSKDFFFFAPEGFFDDTFDATPEDNKHVKLGTLSFRVNPDKLQEMITLFDDWQWNSYEDTDLNIPVMPGPPPVFPSYLLKLTSADDTWTISSYAGEDAEPIHFTSNDPDGAYVMLDLGFNDSLIRAELAEPEVTLNAYQAFTDGSETDVAHLLQKYSPMLELAYANGSMENRIMQWGMDYEGSDGLTYPCNFKLYKQIAEPGTGDLIFVEVDGSAVKYDPRSGVYRARQSFYHEGIDENGDPVIVEFKQPVSAIVRITPVTVIGVDAENLREIYSLDDSALNHYKTIMSLRLPNEARIMTDIVSGASSLTVPVPGWKPDNKRMSDITNMADLEADDNTDPNRHWPTPEEYTSNPTVAIREGRGTYGFDMSQDGNAIYSIGESDINAVYPWLTVNDEYPLRAERILANERYGPNGNDYHDVRYYEAVYSRDYIVPSLGDPATADDLTLELSVKRRDGNGIEAHMTQNSKVRMYLPDGTLVQSGANISNLEDADSWFDISIGESVSMTQILTSTTSSTAYMLAVKPGVTTTAANPGMAVLDKLRSYINLGGWFALSVLETDVDMWSGLIYVYVPPRANEYMESKDYIFSGPNAGLFPHVTPFPQRVSMPQGTYLPVGFDDSFINPGTQSAYAEENYGIAVTYDGVTGRQPGRVHQFEADDYWNLSQYPTINEVYYDTSAPNVTPPVPSVATPISAGWKTASDILTTPVISNLNRTIYGARNPMTEPYLEANPFRTEVKHSAVGAFKNSGKHSSMFVFDDDNAVVAPHPPSPDAEKIIVLPYAGESSGYSTRGDGSVRQITYSTKVVGYTVREEYVLEIRNIGNVDIHGLYIESQRDYDGPAGQYGHSNYQIIDPPASFLPAGGSTTFTIVYEYNLADMREDYLNKIFIGSNSTQVPDAAPWEYLAEFDARFRVSKEPTHRITLVIEPVITGIEVGTAAVVIGEKNALTHEMPDSITGDILSYQSGTPSAFEMDLNAGSYLQDSGRPVFIYVEGYDEYVLESVTYHRFSDPTNEIAAYEYGGVNATAGRAEVDSKSVYLFGMPDEDVIVTVTFTEPLISKLRLGELNVYGSELSTDFRLDPADPNYDPSDPGKIDPAKLQKIYKKVFTEDETNAHADNADLAWHGSAGDEGFTNMPDYNQYLVVLPTEADYYVVEAILRKFISADFPAVSGIQVEMARATVEGNPFLPFYFETNGETTTPSKHRSTSQTSPMPGTSHVIQITIRSAGETRRYYVEIVRRPAELVADYGYGNSPFGMIMNDPLISSVIPAGETMSDKHTAKQKFIDNGYRFVPDRVGEHYVPTSVTNNNLFNMYCREAWAPLNQGFDPDSAQRLYVYNSAIPVNPADPQPYTHSYITDTYNRPAVNNLDLNDYSLFVVPGKTFADPKFRELKDSSMRDVPDTEVTRYIEVVLLDTSAATQMERFNGPNTSALPTYEDYMAAYRTPLRSARIELGTMDTAIPTNWARGYVALGTYDADGKPLYSTVISDLSIRPGIYRLVYEMVDYNDDPIVYTRDIIILPEVGDVNADGVISATDEALLENRFVARLGDDAAGYAKSYVAAPSGDAAVFKYRVLDTNNDRDINHIDANDILYRIDKMVPAPRYYIPINYQSTPVGP